VKHIWIEHDRLISALETRIKHANEQSAAILAQCERLPTEAPKTPSGIPQKTKRSELEAQATAWQRDAFDAQVWLNNPKSVWGDDYRIQLTRDQARWLFKPLATPAVQAIIGELPEDTSDG